MNRIIIKLVSLLVFALGSVVFNSCSTEEEIQSISKDGLQNIESQKKLVQEIVNSTSYENYITSAITFYEKLNFSYNNESLMKLKTENELKNWMVSNQKDTNYNSVKEFELFMNEFKNYQTAFKNQQQQNLSNDVATFSKSNFKETFIATLYHNEQTQYKNISLSDCGIQAVNGIRNVRNNAIFSLIYLESSDENNLNLQQLFAIFTTYKNSVTQCSDLLSDCLKTQ